MRRGRTTVRRWVVPVVLLPIVLGAAACSGSEPAGPPEPAVAEPTTTTSTVAPTTTTVPAPVDETGLQALLDSLAPPTTVAPAPAPATGGWVPPSNPAGEPPPDVPRRAPGEVTSGGSSTYPPDHSKATGPPSAICDQYGCTHGPTTTTAPPTTETIQPGF